MARIVNDALISDDIFDDICELLNIPKEDTKDVFELGIKLRIGEFVEVTMVKLAKPKNKD